MIQGTASDVGKSFVVTGLLRALKKRGITCAPFKSQNMSNNSRISSEGHELGTAQAVQAEAAGAKLTSLMNPILLKPASDNGSQVLVRDVSFGHLKAGEYQKLKVKLKAEIVAAFNNLAKQYDYVVVEGAGSPAEINLREEDLVNMGLAEEIDAPVILVADIDRGGVFASIYGTYMLLSESEKKRLMGYVINKFRGDVELLKPGLEQLKDYIPLECLGVIPYSDIEIDVEDSLSFKNKLNALSQVRQQESLGVKEYFDIAIVKVGHIANVCDYANFERFKNISVRYISCAEDMSNAQSPDLLILPGTKATVKDMQLLHEHGLADEIKKYISQGGAVFGLCGGLQMLGKSLEDPDGVEGVPLRAEGLGVFPYTTKFIEQKTQCLTSCTLKAQLEGELSSFSNQKLSGYEIHNGVSTLEAGRTDFLTAHIKAEPSRQDSLLNYVSGDGKIFATYLHGIFDDDRAVELICKQARPDFTLQKRADAEESLEAYKDKQYEKLAALLEEHLDLDDILARVEAFSKEG